MDGWLVHASRPGCDGGARPRVRRTTAPPSIQALPSALTGALLASPSCSTGEQRVAKEEAEGPPGSSQPRRGNLFTTSSSSGKPLKQLAFTKPFYFQIITPSREVSLSAERSQVHLAISWKACPAAMHERRDQETLVVLSPLSRLRLPVGRGLPGLQAPPSCFLRSHVPPSSLTQTAAN